MDGRPLLYHERQESLLCAVHCLNAVLQGPYFSELELASIARDLDQTEQAMLGSANNVPSEGSANVSMDGNFSIQVLQRALGALDLKAVPLTAPEAESARSDPQRQSAFICHLQEHWFALRKVYGEWYNFNSLFHAPEHLSSFYMSAFLDTLKNDGWSIFVVLGDLPKDYNSAGKMDSAGSYGKWFTPKQAKHVLATRGYQALPGGDEDDDPMLSEAIAQSLRESGAGAGAGASGAISQEDSDLAMAIAASLADVKPPV